MKAIDQTLACLWP